MKKVFVMLSAYNGEKYIKQQIDSILGQKNVAVTLMIRDDGSKDSTPQIITSVSEQDNRVMTEIGENIGFRRSFYDMLLKSPDDYDYYAFSDQDDVWEPEKLYRAVQMLKDDPSELKLYASALNVVNQDLEPMYVNAFSGIRISYGSALSRQRLAGCTMVFNTALVQLYKKFRITAEMGDLFSHDAAVYYICLACGGSVVFDKESYINFRRHEGTVTEHGKGFMKRVSSVLDIFGKKKNRRYNQVRYIKKVYGRYLTEETADLSEEIIEYKKSFRNTIKLMKDKRIRCGIKSVDAVNSIAILFHCY